MSESVCFNGCDLNYERILEKNIDKVSIMRLTPSGSFVAYYEDVESVFGHSEGANKANWFIRVWEGKEKNMGAIICIQGTFELPDKEREILYMVFGERVDSEYPLREMVLITRILGESRKHYIRL